LILYLDTSSLIKLYVTEQGTPEVEGLAIDASLVCTSGVAYPEARSALARLCREGTLSTEAHAQAKADLDRDWPHFLAIDVTAEVWQIAGDLAEEHALRGFDSIHLASFLHLVEADFGEPARFSSFDDQLNNALRSEVEAALLREEE
jgi:predicted nucleic acid-binding protein